MHEKEKRRREPQQSYHVIKSTMKTKMDVFLSSALKCVGFSNGQPRIHQGNQIHGFGCLAFEIGTTWIFFNFEHSAHRFSFIASELLVSHYYSMCPSYRELTVNTFLMTTIGKKH